MLALVSAALLSGSCEKKIDFSPDDVSPYVVMMSRPVSDSLMTVYVGYSRFFLDNGHFGSIGNATVTVSAGGVTYAGVYDSTCFRTATYYGYYDEYYDDYYDTYGGYRFMLRPKVGDTLRLSAQVPGHDGEVSAVTVVPPLPQIEVLDFVCDTIDEPYGDIYFKIRFRIKCNSNKEYFNLRVLTAERRFINDSTGYWDTTDMEYTYFTVNDPIVNSTSIADAIDGYDGSFSGNSLDFSSEMFTGGEHEFTVELDRWGSDTWGLETWQTPIVLSVKAMSEDLYKYNTTRDGYSSDFDDLFSEPVQVFCNIDGGIGIFGASSIRRVTMPAPRIENFPHSGGYYYKSQKKARR